MSKRRIGQSYPLTAILLVELVTVVASLVPVDVLPPKDPGPADVHMEDDKPLPGWKSITFLEESDVPFSILRVKQDGADKPEASVWSSDYDPMKLEFNPEGGYWTLNVTLKQDYEDELTSKGYRVDIKVKGKESTSVSITVLNIDDNPPIMSAESSFCSFDENWNGTTDCLITIKDADLSYANLSVDIQENGEPSKNFGYVHHENGVVYKLNLTVLANLDYEEKNIYSVDVIAKDKSYSENYTAVASIVIKIKDISDLPPVWSTRNPIYNIPENENFSVQLQAYDGDINVNLPIYYKLNITDDAEKYFKVDKDTGLLTVESIDRDIPGNDRFQFYAIAYEDPPPPTENQTETPLQVIFMIQDINDNPPKFHLPSITTSINESSTSLTMSNIAVTDPDLGVNGTFDVKLMNDGNGTDFIEAFSVVPSQGYQTAPFSVLVVNPNLLDYENEDWRHIRMKLVATAAAKPIETAELKISIDLLNINDEYPEFDKTLYVANVMENAEVGSLITTLTATDRDGSIDKITYSTTSSTIVTINNETGEVKAAKSNSFDYELAHEVVVQVIATDLAGHFAYTQLQINIEDENDVAPTLHMPASKMVVMEDATVGSIIPESYISAVDPDTDADLIFMIDYGTSSSTSNGIPVNETMFDGFFDIVPDPGCGQQDNADSDTKCAVLKVAKILHWEIFDTIILNISVTDNNTLPQYPERRVQSAFLTITIKDVNNNPPVISEIPTLVVTENSKVDQTIGNVVATDADFNTTLVYFLTPTDDTPEGWVKINDKGVLYVGFAEIDCDYNPDKLFYIVRVFDGVNNATTNIEIQIEDINDLPPVVQNTSMTKKILESTTNGKVFQIKATDGDRTAPFNVVSYLMDPLYPNCWFAVDIESGWITVDLTENCTLDRETQEKYDIHIVVRDNYQNTSDYNSHPISTYVTLTLIDINDNPPEFIEVPQSCQTDILETTEQDTLLITITAQDKDKDITYTKIDFTIMEILPLNGAKDPNDGGVPLFNIKTSKNEFGYKGEIFAGRSLHGYVGHYNLTIRANNTLDKENPNNVERAYTICIEDVNDNPPVITFPEQTNMIFLIFDTQPVNDTIILYNQNPLPLFEATDADFGKNSAVDFELVGTDYARRYFRIIPGDKPNTAKLLLKKNLDISSLEERQFELHINATDGGDNPLKDVTTAIFRVLTNEPNAPYFEERDFNVTFEENLITEFNFTGAFDADNMFKPSNLQDEIYYTIVDGNKTLFSIDKRNEAILTIVKGLDYEDRHNYTVLIRASNDDSDPDSFDDLLGPDILNITVFVTDINDTPPRFVEELYVGGISSTDQIDSQVFQVKANDPDTNDQVTYGLMWETMQANGSFDDHINSNFKLDSSTGKLTLNFKLQPSMKGFFTFKINATDLGSHSAIVPAQVFAINDANRENFKFENTKEFVESNQEAVKDVLTNYLAHSCHILTVEPVTDHDTGKVTNTTSVNTLFMDDNKNLPVDSSVIYAAINVFATQNQLRKAFSQKGLIWKDFGTSAPSQPQDEGFQQTILIVVSAVLATLVLLLLAAFFFKTRRLNRRLEALSQTKFGSLDSGLNRVGMNVPNTNQHALEGSNPVWNEQIENDDNSSQGSGDSDLVGIEDSPEFKQQGDALETRMSNGSDGHYGNQNFSFGPAKPSEPTTEL